MAPRLTNTKTSNGPKFSGKEEENVEKFLEEIQTFAKKIEYTKNEREATFINGLNREALNFHLKCETKSEALNGLEWEGDKREI